MLPFVMIAVASCTESAGPSASRPAYVECFARWGLGVIEHRAYKAGNPSTYTFDNRDLSGDVIAAALAECSPKLTDANIRQTYDRWLIEWGCLRDAGYKPDPPPTFDKFLIDWKTVGPWMPIDGISIDGWSDEEVVAAKTRCGLDYYDRDGLPTPPPRPAS